MKDNPTVAWLLGEQSPLYDIQKLLKACLILPVLGYGLKAICTDKGLVDFQWGLEESGSQWSVVRYNDLLVEENIEEQEKIKYEILRYNKDDVLAMRALEIWLRTLS